MDKNAEALIKARHDIGLFSIKEIREMFPRKDGKPMSRYTIDYLINSNQLKYVSPNGRDRYVFLKDYITATTNYNKKKMSPSFNGNSDT